jgi:hypothetical protein
MHTIGRNLGPNPPLAPAGGASHVYGGIVHEGVAFTPSNENSRLGYFRGNTEEYDRMTVQELINILSQFDPTRGVVVALFKTDGTSEIFEIEEIGDNKGNAQLKIYDEEEI